jgi:sec-independent protein translocase protein TatA
VVGLDNPIHLLLLFVIVLLVFGAKRLPELGRSLGSGLRGFKQSINGEAPDESHMALSSTTAEHAGAEGQQPVESRPAA